ncbi:MAG: LD-carboxypeptidase [Gemmatimonadaceae bacterium]
MRQFAYVPRAFMRRQPPLLFPGAHVALVSPAGPLAGEEQLARAIANTRLLGWEPMVGENAMARRRYLAGEDAERVGDLNRAIRDPEINGIWCLRGGYGAMRLLDFVDYESMRRNPKVLLGYSDITALHAAIGERCDIITYHGPTARGALTPFTRDSLERAVVVGGDSCGLAGDAVTLYAGSADGYLAGGNLALIAALVGTPYAPSFRDAIVILEDVGERVYRIDRMLQQLKLSGTLDACAALVFGAFTERGGDDDNCDGALQEVFAAVADWLGRPCVANFPIGHLEDQWTLPLGARAALEADSRPPRLTIIQHRPSGFLES